MGPTGTHHDTNDLEMITQATLTYCGYCNYSSMGHRKRAHDVAAVQPGSGASRRSRAQEVLSELIELSH